MRPTFRLTIFFVSMLFLFTGCGSKSSEKRYQLQGTIISVDTDKNLVTVEHGDIPGFMSAMTMSYELSVPKDAEGLAPGDKITADLIVSRGVAHLEKIQIVSKASGGAQKTGTP